MIVILIALLLAVSVIYAAFYALLAWGFRGYVGVMVVGVCALVALLA